MSEETEGKKTDVNEEKFGDMPVTSSDVLEASSSHKKKKKSKKQKHEKIPEETQVKDGEGAPTGVSDEKIVDIPATSTEVPKESSHEKKKSRKDKREMPEGAEDKKTDVNAMKGGNGIHTAVNDETIADMPASSSEVHEGSSNRRKKKKSKKSKQETEVPTEKMPEEAGGKKGDVNAVEDGSSIRTDVIDKKIGDMPPTTCEVPEEPSSHRKNKKSRKDKHEMPEGAESKKTDVNTVGGGNDIHTAVNDEKIGDVQASRSDVQEGSSDRQKKKKSKKDKQKTEVPSEKMPEEAGGKKTDVNAVKGGSATHTAVNDEKIGDMPASGNEVPGDSNSHKKHKKSKKLKHKHESDLPTEKMLKEPEGKNTDVNAVKEDGDGVHTAVNDKKGCSDETNERKDQRSGMSERGVDVSPDTVCPSKDKKAKKRKHGIDEEGETEGKKLEVCVGVENEKNALVPTGSHEVTEESSSREKRKKAKKHKRQSDLSAEELLEVTKGRKNDNNVPRSDTDGIGEPGRRTESKEARRQKSDTDVPEESEIREIDIVVEDTKSGVVPTGDNEGTVESSRRRKKKKAKKSKHESEKIQESNDENKEDKKNTVVPESCANASSELSSDTKCKVATKRKHESEEMVEEKKDEKTEKSEDMPASSNEIAGESKGHKKKKKEKKHKRERDKEERGNSVLKSD